MAYENNGQITERNGKKYKLVYSDPYTAREVLLPTEAPKKTRSPTRSRSPK